MLLSRSKGPLDNGLETLPILDTDADADQVLENTVAGGPIELREVGQ